MLKKFFSYILIFTALNVFAQNSSLRVNTDQMFLEAVAPRNYIINSGAEKNDSSVTDASSIHTRSTSGPLTGAASHAIDGTASSQNVDFLANNLQAGLLGQNCEASFTLSGDASLYTVTVRINGADVTTAQALTNISNSTQIPILFPCGTSGVSPVIRITSTSASAAAIKVDDVYFGKAVSLGNTQQNIDWTSFPMTISSTGTPPTKGTISVDKAYWRRIGDSAEIKYDLHTTSAGTNGTGTYVFPMPAGMSIDTSKSVSTSVNQIGVVGFGGAFDSARSRAVQVLVYSASGVSLKTIGTNAGGTDPDPTDISASAFSLGNTEVKYSFSFKVPIVGWTSQPTTNTALPFAPTVQKFTSGSGTYTTPAGVQWIKVRMVGGGGGGSGSGTAASTAGTAGGNTYFRVGASPEILLANGGGGGQSSHGGGAGGGGGGHTLNSPAIGTGMNGANGSGNSITNTFIMSGMGGSSYFGGAGAGAQAGGAGIAASANTGSGGSGGGGCSGSCYTGNGGGSGSYIEAIIKNPSASYAYSVGTGGGGGAAGTGGTAGGAGAAGYIEVTEYYSTSMPAIIGSVTSNSSGSERIERAQIAMAGGACSLTNQSGSWISSVTYNSLGKCTLNFVAGIWGSAPTCQATMNRDNEVWPTISTAATTSSIQIGMRRPGSPFFVDEPFTIQCMGPR
jgi:hypothetical protein